MKEIPAYIKFSILAVGIAVVVSAMVFAKLLVIPVIWAMLLSLMVLPVAKWWEKRVKHRALAAIITIFLLIVFVGAILTLFISQVISLGEDAPAIESKFTGYVEDIRHFAEEQLGIPFDEQPEQLKSQLSATSQDLLGRVGSTLQHTLTTIGLLVIVPIYMFFFLNYRERFLNFVVKLSHTPKTAHTIETMTKASKVVQKYLRGVAIEMLVVGVMTGILFLALGVKHALFFAVLVATLNVIPYIGVFISSIISVVYVFLTKDGMAYPILVFVFLWVIQIIDNNFIAPYVVGQQLKLNPFGIIVAVILGGLIWGISGMVIFIPLLGVAKVVFDESATLKPFGYLLGDHDDKAEKIKEKKGEKEET